MNVDLFVNYPVVDFCDELIEQHNIIIVLFGLVCENNWKDIGFILCCCMCLLHNWASDMFVVCVVWFCEVS